MREINKIIVHCSDSDFGNAGVIDKWHRGRGWNEIGYHYVVLNGKPVSGAGFDSSKDGIVEVGRDISKRGAHCYGHNKDSIGICLIGRHHFTAKQLCSSLPSLIERLRAEYNISEKNIFGHNQFNVGKTCPNFDLDLVREVL